MRLDQLNGIIAGESHTGQVIERKFLGIDWNLAYKMKAFYLFLLVPLIWVLIFCYYPMYGVTIAFKDYSMGKGILGSPWNNFHHFAVLFKEPSFLKVLRNTVILNVYSIVFSFPAPIILALLFNEIRNLKFKKVVQTISYLPTFLSWVILATMITEFLSPQSGPLNYLLSLLGIKPIYFLAEKSLFRGIIISTGIWASIGWNSVIYLASISSIDQELYEAAEIDGATRFQMARYITLTSIMPVVVFLFLMNMGNILKSSFDQVFNLLNPMVMEVGQVIDVYVYNVGLIDASYDFATAVGLFVNIVGILMLITANTIARQFSEYSLW